MTFVRFMVHFASLADPRVERTRHHGLRELVFMTVLAVVCGEESWDDTADFASERKDWRGTLLNLPHGTPCADTFRRVWSAIDPKQFNACFTQWLQSPRAGTDGKLVAIDGKTLRGSGTPGRPPLHMVSAWVLENNLIFGQVATHQKSNEITAIPELLETLDLKGATVNIDAMGCQKTIAKKILEKKASYLLAVKGNHPHPHEDIKEYFDDARISFVGDEDIDVDKGHGRLEWRRVRVCRDIKWIDRSKAFAKLSAIVEVEARRTFPNHSTRDRRLYVTSSTATAAVLARQIRGHWGIENKVHWMLDVTLREDGARPRKDHAPEDVSVLRRLTMNLLKQVAVPKKPDISVRRKRKRANRNVAFLQEVLLAAYAEN